MDIHSFGNHLKLGKAYLISWFKVKIKIGIKFKEIFISMTGCSI